MSKCFNDYSVCLEHVNSCKFFSSTNVNESAFKDNRTNGTSYRKKTVPGGTMVHVRVIVRPEKCLKIFEVLIPGGVV